MARNEFGSAKWGNQDGETLEGLFYARNFLVGTLYDEEKKDRWVFLGTKRHLFTTATTRSGKGVSLIIPNLLNYPGSAIVIDPKGENAWITARFRREGLKQKTIILDPWDEVNRRYGNFTGEKETVARFNPLSVLDPESPHYADDLAYLADALIINQGKDPHWDDSARELVSGIIAYLIEKDKRTATLPFMREILCLPSDEIAIIAKKAQALGRKSVAARKLGRFVNESRELSSVISTALTQTAFLDSETLGKNLEFTDFSFEDLLTGRATIYLVLPVDKLQTYGRWLRLMISIGIRTVAREVKRAFAPVLFILDEFGTIGRLSAVAQAYGLMAGLNMCVWAFVQDLAQLKRDYPDEWETFISNSQALIGFDVMDMTTADYFSKMLGTKTGEIISQETASKREDGFFSLGDPDYTQMSDKHFARPLAYPEEIRNSSRGYMIGRFNPIFYRRVAYYEEPLLYGRARVDPHFPDEEGKHEKAKSDFLLWKKKTLDAKRKFFAAENVPHFPAAKEYIEKMGFSVEVKAGLLKSPVVIKGANGQERTFKHSQEFLFAVREIEEERLRNFFY